MRILLSLVSYTYAIYLGADAATQVKVKPIMFHSCSQSDLLTPHFYQLPGHFLHPKFVLKY